VADPDIRVDIHLYLDRVGIGIPYPLSLTAPGNTKLLSPPTKKERIETFRAWREKIRADLLALTGVDVVELASQKIVRHPPWNIYSMRCAKCDKGWTDGVGISKHHKIPTRLGKALGLTIRRINEPNNLVPLCVAEHLEADQAVRNMVKELHPEMYCWGDLTSY